MAFEEMLEPRTVLASGDLSASQYRMIVLDGSGNAALAGANARAYGVLQTKPTAAGQASTVARNGISKCVAGAAYAVGVLLATDANGRVVLATTGQNVVGIARKAAGGAGELQPVEIVNSGVAP
jgi:hypothetical protein